MKMRFFPRLFTAMVTPFKNDRVDLDGLISNIHFQIEAGVKGLLFLASTGEGASLTMQEREEVIATAAAHVKNKATLMVATGAASTHQALLFSQQAEKLGADALLVVTPYYTCPTQEGIVAHFEKLCQAIKTPICLYNNPRRSGTALDVSTVKRLIQWPQIFALKESVNDLSHLMEVKGSTNLTLYCGDDPFVIPSMALGAFGLISVASNLFPSQILELVNLCSIHQMEMAREKFYALYEILGALFSESNPIGIKAAMNLQGLEGGECRLPLKQMSGKSLMVLKERLEKYGEKKPIVCQSSS